MKAIQIYHMKQSILCLLFLTVSVYSITTINYTCIEDPSCSSGYTYRFTGKNLDFKQCANYSCGMSYSFEVFAQACNTDYTGAACKTQVCFDFQNGNIEMCFLASTSCKNYSGFNYSKTIITCQDCSNCTSPNRCITSQQYPKFTEGVQFCIANCTFDRSQFVYKDCSRDSFGKPCLCCMNGKIQGLEHSGICTYGTPLDNENVSSYVKNSEQYFRTYIILILLALLIIQQ